MPLAAYKFVEPDGATNSVITYRLPDGRISLQFIPFSRGEVELAVSRAREADDSVPRLPACLR